MKFLVDAHLPLSLCRALVERGHDAIHTSSLPGGNATTDDALRSVAIAQGRVLMTKDLDFFDGLGAARCASEAGSVSMWEYA